MPDLRKGYSNLLRPSPVEDLPVPWAEAEGDHNYTVTLFAFAWALLPVGFMVMMALFDRYQQHRLTLASVALLMLVLAFVSGVGQRKSALLESRVQFAAANLASSALVLVLLFALGLEAYWWVAYGLVFGSVATMYVALNHLASCDATSLRLPWSPTDAIPTEALDGWRVVNGRWTNGVLATKRIEDGAVLTLHGVLEDGSTFLCLDRLCPAAGSPNIHALGIDVVAFAALATVPSGEE